MSLTKVSATMSVAIPPGVVHSYAGVFFSTRPANVALNYIIKY